MRKYLLAAAAALSITAIAGNAVAEVLACNDPLVGTNCPSSKFVGWTETSSTGGGVDKYWYYCPGSSWNVCEFVNIAPGVTVYTAISPGNKLIKGITASVETEGSSSSSLVFNGDLYDPAVCGGSVTCEAIIIAQRQQGLDAATANPLWREPGTGAVEDIAE